MKKFKKALAVLTTAAISAISLCSMFSASASVTQYNTFRVYADVKPSSGLQYHYLTLSIPRYTVYFGDTALGNIEGDYYQSGDAGDAWKIGVKIFQTSADITDAGTLYRWNFYSSRAETNFWDFATLNENYAKNSAGNIISPCPVEVTAVMVGDINQDGAVNWLDVTAINSYLNGSLVLSEAALRSADINNDGLVNYNDTSKLISYASGEIAHFCN